MATSPEAGARVHFPPPVVFLLAIAGGLLLQFFVLPLHFRMPRAAQIVLGVVALGAALRLGLPALRLFRKTGQDPKPWAPTPELIFDGPYRWTRNPLYLGMTAIGIAVGLFANCLWIVFLSLAALAVVHVIAVRPEEEYLRRKFGAPYEEYLQRVKRYV